MIETRVEVKKSDVPDIAPRTKVLVNAKELIVLEIEEDAVDPILMLRCGPEYA